MALPAESRERLVELHSNLLSDVTDEMGIYENVVPCTRFQPVWDGRPTVGTAHTIQTVDVGYRKDHPDDAEEMLGLQALEAVDEGDFVVRAAPDGVDAGLWGELLSTTVAARGGVGALVDGPTRDSRLIEEHRFPVWSKGQSAIESFGRVDEREYGVPVELEGVVVEPGDVVFADRDSIVVLPPDDVETIIERAEEIRDVEDQVRTELRDGRSITDVWDEYETL